MSNRFHNKYHRHNHHTDSVNDPRYPDSSHDPIASPEAPFLGDFVMFGQLSAVEDDVNKSIASFVHINGGTGVNIETTGLALSAKGNAQIAGSLSVYDIKFTGDVFRTFSEPVTAGDNFLLVRLTNNNTGEVLNRAVRLWEYTF